MDKFHARKMVWGIICQLFIIEIRSHLSFTRKCCFRTEQILGPWLFQILIQLCKKSTCSITCLKVADMTCVLHKHGYILYYCMLAGTCLVCPSHFNWRSHSYTFLSLSVSLSKGTVYLWLFITSINLEGFWSSLSQGETMVTCLQAFLDVGTSMLPLSIM